MKTNKDTQLLEISPAELKFTIDSVKAHVCLLHLKNSSTHSVAFKVKTTSPKKYIVKSNTGVIHPNCDVTVTVTLVDKVDCLNGQCKDKFLIQSTIFDSNENEVASDFFNHPENKVYEKKMRVVLVFPEVKSPVLSPLNSASMDPAMHRDEASMISVGRDGQIAASDGSLIDQNSRKSPPATQFMQEHHHLLPEFMQQKLAAESQLNQDLNQFMTDCGALSAKDEGLLVGKFQKNLQEIMAKLIDLEAKLHEAESAIVELKEDKLLCMQERVSLGEEVVALRRKASCVNGVQGIPLLVVVVTLVSLVLGYISHAGITSYFKPILLGHYF